MSDRIIALRHTLHACAEVSCREKETIETLIVFIEKNTKLTVVREEGWFYAFYKCSTQPKRPAIAFRADMDALPMKECMEVPYASKDPDAAHKCGHDGHSAALAGLACRLSEIRPDRDVYLIFQHGEEIGAGGEPCSRLLIEKEIGEVYACHNWSGLKAGEIYVKSGISQCASQGLLIHFAGKPAHASQPEDGKNPAAAISELALWIKEQVGENRLPLMATIVGMRAGGQNFGMSASEGELCVTLRAEAEADMKDLKNRTLRKAQELAQQYGLSTDYEEADLFPETVCDADCVEKVLKAGEKEGIPCHLLEKPFRASEDFGHFLKKCPGAIFYIGNGEDYPEIHTEDYDFRDENLEVIIKMFETLCRE